MTLVPGIRLGVYEVRADWGGRARLRSRHVQPTRATARSRRSQGDAMQVGRKLGAYEVIAKIGEGGMGEVYHAHDATLNRDVALKILPESFALDPDRLARFKREAQVLAYTLGRKTARA